MLGRNRTRLLAVLPAAALAVAAVWVGSSAADAGTRTIPTKRVQANNLYFCAYTKAACASTDTGHVTRIKVGTRVRWVYKDTYCDMYPICPGHDVKVRTWTKSATVKTEGATIYSHVFRHTGRFTYICTHHGNTGMTGVIRVVSG